jgi:hypothetical protein
MKLSAKVIKTVGIVPKDRTKDGIEPLRAEQIAPLMVSAAQVASHDFH